MNTTSSPSSTASELISCAATRDPVEHRLQHRHHLVRTQIGAGERQHVRRQREQLAVGRDEAAALEREENAARGGARQVGGAREVAQRHRAAGGRRTSAAAAGRGRGSRRNRWRAPRRPRVSALACCGPMALAGQRLCLPSHKTCHNSPIRSIGEHNSAERSRRHDEPGSERPDHPDRVRKTPAGN